jgi:hypothetical protein
MEECLPKMPFAQILLTYSAMMDALAERCRKRYGKFTFKGKGNPSLISL